MPRAIAVLPAGDVADGMVVDRVVLDADDRHRRRVAMTGEGGTAFLLDLPRAVALRDGDGLRLEDGRIVRVVARPEPLVEITAESPDGLARLAWHIGNRHTAMQVAGGRLRIRRDHVLEAMLRGLGATLAAIEAPFDPEAGAYDHAPSEHAHAAHGHRHADHHHADDDHPHGQPRHGHPHD
ncbi:Urease accessory protein UreE 1 [Rhodoplanes serenus]|uniref:Urease accessory protein UreE n=1 Tax=Rhodoplanes serenus TaxID=200615 RepID=A0A3S4DIB7_9BRAD|nr:urease accessory protein UreE [Rhodoplanes serenus]VCU11045.1 Urease accessory protein UreE 1 [Rhodoplanes serenus]